MSSVAVSPSCPASNGASFVSQGQTFNIRCGSNWPFGDIGRVKAATFEECITTCSTTSGCVDTVYFPSSQKCWLKNTLTKYKADAGAWGAVLASVEQPTCTGNQYDGVVYTTVAGSHYQISCGKDSKNNDISKAPSPDLKSCMSTCDQTEGCIGAAYRSSICYLKSFVKGNLSTNSRVTFLRKVADPALPPVTDGPCANGAAFMSDYKDDKGNVYGVCANTNFPGQDIRGGDLPHDLNAADADVYCAKLCTTVAGCVMATAITNYCYLKEGTPAAQPANGVTAFLRKNPPGPGTGPCYYGADFATQITSGDYVYGVCRNTDLLGSDIDAIVVPSDTDGAQFCAQECSQRPECLSASYHADLCYPKHDVPATSLYVGVDSLIRISTSDQPPAV